MLGFRVILGLGFIRISENKCLWFRLSSALVGRLCLGFWRECFGFQFRVTKPFGQGKKQNYPLITNSPTRPFAATYLYSCPLKIKVTGGLDNWSLDNRSASRGVEPRVGGVMERG